MWRNQLRNNFFNILVIVWLLALIIVGVLAHYGPKIIDEQANAMEKRGEYKSR